MFHMTKRVEDGIASFGIFYGPQLVCNILVKEKGKEMISVDVYDGFRDGVASWTDIIEDADGTS